MQTKLHRVPIRISVVLISLIGLTGCQADEASFSVQEETITVPIREAKATTSDLTQEDPAQCELETEEVRVTDAEIKLQLNYALIDGDRLVIEVDLIWNDPNWLSIEIIDFENLGPKGGDIPSNFNIIDVSGKIIPLYVDQTLATGFSPNQTRHTYILYVPEFIQNQFEPPYTIILKAVEVNANVNQSLLIDLGEEVVDGQIWMVDQQFDVYGQEIQVVELELQSGIKSMGGGGGPGITPVNPNYALLIRTEQSEEITDLSLGSPAVDGGSVNASGLEEMFGEGVSNVDFYVKMPSGEMELCLFNMTFLLQGLWQERFTLE